MIFFNFIFSLASGGYTLFLDGEKETEVVGENFGSETSFNFGCGGPTDPPAGSPTGDGNCSDDQATFDFVIRTDGWGTETSWELTNDQQNKVLSGGENGVYENDQTYRTEACIAKGCYTMTILDSYGDG